MPELPEVQTVISNLKRFIINQNIDFVEIYYPKLLKNSMTEEFKTFLINEKIIDITRKGKFIIFNLSNNKKWVIHLRMEGKLFFEPFNSSPTHLQLLAELKLSNGLLRYYDTRKFGTFHILKDNEFLNFQPLLKLGPDANDDNLNFEELFKHISKRNISIKTLLLDQCIISGIGNIYANEILFSSNISPFRKGNEINLEEWKEILKNSKIILNESIENNGTTIHSFKFDNNHSGGYQKFLKVHGKKNQPCPICNNPINYTKINGRGTFYCKNCQK